MLYIVATPIGNLMDLSYRAIETLKTVDLIIAEDTRRSKILLNHYQISTKISSLHEHNEEQVVEKFITMLHQGKQIALISDAGTPLISDPGYNLVRRSHLEKIRVSPIPGSSAILAAISASGLATDQFVFLGFIPHKLSSKLKLFKSLKLETKTMIFFESPHRILNTLKNMLDIFGKTREIAFCRELTKQFETIVNANLLTVYDFVVKDLEHQTKGEIVLVLAGDIRSKTIDQSMDGVVNIDANAHRILEELSHELPLTKASKIAAKITGIDKQKLYDYWLNVIKN